MLTQPGGETVTVTAVEHVHRPVVDPRVGAESVPLVLIGEAAMRVKGGRPREALHDRAGGRPGHRVQPA
jgi:hypothetical protein